MTEPVLWDADGTPRNPRFNDASRSHSDGLAQARHVFLAGSGLLTDAGAPTAWEHQPQWRVLETGFGLGLNFLATWHAWRADPARPRLLHMVSIEAHPVSAADLLRSVLAWPELIPLAEALCAQWRGLLPGFHRLALDGGQVLLTLCVGDVQAALRELAMQADSVFLDGCTPERNPAMWSAATLKAVARHCRRGTTLASGCAAPTLLDSLTQCGFVVQLADGRPPEKHRLAGRYDPAWVLKRDGLATPPTSHSTHPARCVVVGAGLAGAAAAASLARRGWRVQVLDSAPTPASGASGLPVGLLAPPLSPDDNPLSRLSRAGARLTHQFAHTHLREGVDWQPSGVLEHRLDGDLALPRDWPEAGLDWTREASADERQRAGLAAPGSGPAGDANGVGPGTGRLGAATAPVARWHAMGGWIKPARLVATLLAQPGVAFRGGVVVESIEPLPGGGWTVRDARGVVLAEAELVVLAAGYASRKWLGAEASDSTPLSPVRGQISWGITRGRETALPPFPVNGHGSLIAGVPLDGQPAWLVASTYARDDADTALRDADHAANRERLRTLLPAASAVLDTDFETGQVHGWAGVRCATPDRLPMVGPTAAPGLWVSTGMGSRGLTFALLCGEMLAARLHGEPLPIERRLALRLDSGRAGLKTASNVDLGIK